MNKQAGGPAFPVTISNLRKKATAGFNGDEIAASTSTIYGGMSLRNYFAAKAMKVVGWNYDAVEKGAACCYEIADAMLAERAK